MKKKVFSGRKLELLKIISFILVFVLLLEGVSLAFFPEETATKYKNKKRLAYSFTQDYDNTIQIVGIGNSDLYSGFSPLDFWEKFGYTSTVCASPRQNVRESKKLLELVYESQNPKVVLIEVDMLYTHRPKKLKQVERINKLSSFFDRLDPDIFEENIEDIFSIFKFHNYWKGGKLKKTKVNTHGYKYKDIVCKLKKKNYMKKTWKKEPISAINMERMSSLIKYCKKKKAKVILVAIPSPISWNYLRYNAVKTFAKKKRVPYIDLNLKYAEMNISMKNCFRDNGNHLNYKGARAVTYYLGKYISKKYRIKNRWADIHYKKWNDDLKRFEKYKKRKKQKKQVMSFD